MASICDIDRPPSGWNGFDLAVLGREELVGVVKGAEKASALQNSAVGWREKASARFFGVEPNGRREDDSVVGVGAFSLPNVESRAGSSRLSVLAV